MRALILAAGPGSRIFPYELTRQKAALPVGQTSLARWTHDCLDRAGVSQIAVVVGHLEQRVRNFMGNGLKLYSEYVSCKVPFLNNTWISLVWNLKRSWKLGSNWHRFAIAGNYPQLLDFPITGKRGLEAASRMYPRAPLLYWASSRKSHALVPYEKCTQWFQDEVILEFIRDNAALVSELVQEETVRSIVDEQRRGGSRSHAVAFLLTMIFWIKNLRDIYDK